MKIKQYFSNYFKNIYHSLESIDSAQLEQAVYMVGETHQSNKKIIVVGNGGSAAMASHVAVDFVKAAGIRAINFNEADLTRADLRKSKLHSANLQGACLLGARLEQAVLREADLRNADLGEAILYGANFGRAELEGARFADAKSDATTVWPKGFDPKIAGLLVDH